MDSCLKVRHDAYLNKMVGPTFLTAEALHHDYAFFTLEGGGHFLKLGQIADFHVEVGDGFLIFRGANVGGRNIDSAGGDGLRHER